MKSKTGFYSSSLEMLLDTMCNLLGAIVFIALIVALVAHDAAQTEPGRAPNPSETAASLAVLNASNAMVESELQKTLQRLQDPHMHPVTNVMRLPEISNSTNRPWLVFVQHGQVFPLELISSDGRTASPNHHSLTRNPPFVETREGMGEDPVQYVTKTISAFKSGGRTNYQFSFYVFADSFGAFNHAREVVANLGFQYAWEPQLLTNRLQIGTQGERILPQN